LPAISTDLTARTEQIRPLRSQASDYDPLLRESARARFVLLGEASHGTHEFYRERTEITKRLIAEQGVTAVAAEADWPDAYRVNLFVRGENADETAVDALANFRRFPAWMWRNADVVDFVGWLREWNDALPTGAPKVGFYGLDLYSLYTSIAEVIAYLERIDPQAAERARRRYSCFDHFNRDPQVYAYETALGGAEPCERQTIEQLVELQRSATELAQRDGWLAQDRHFYAEQNARLVANAEAYYRSVFYGGSASWNLRDRHMAETLEALVNHLDRTQGPANAAVWAHNSHVGDAAATQFGRHGQLNIGQLMRERHGDETLIVGFTTYTGTVTAASDWGAQAERKRVLPALEGSWEDVFHGIGLPGLLLIPNGFAEQQRLERAIGVIYKPETERLSHYFEAKLADQFDAVIYIDQSRAVEPLERTSVWEEGELPETYPFAV
jgi:erythromycin esterase-like protein